MVRSRRQYQYAFIGAVAVLAARPRVSRYRCHLAARPCPEARRAGLVFVLAFVTVRAMSFHHVDALIGTRVLNVRVNWISRSGA